MPKPSKVAGDAAKEYRQEARLRRTRVTRLRGELMDPNSGIENPHRRRMLDAITHPPTKDGVTKLDRAVKAFETAMREMVRRTGRLISSARNAEVRENLRARIATWLVWGLKLRELQHNYHEELMFEEIQTGLQAMADALRAVGE